MKQAVVQVFDDHLADMSRRAGRYRVTKYTSLEHTDLLASADQIGIQAVVDVISANADVPLTVAVEHTANGYEWKAKNPLPEVSTLIPMGGKTIALAGGERLPVRPSQRFVRLRIDAGDETNPFAIGLKVYVSARTRATRGTLIDPFASHAGGRFPRTALLFGIQEQTLHELHDLAQAARHMEDAARTAFVLRGMSVPSRREVVQLVTRLRGLDDDSKRLLVSIAKGVIRLLAIPAGGEPPGDESAEAVPTPCAHCDATSTAAET